MSIVNISSENLISGTDAHYEVRLKQPLMRCIGVQVLNVTVPLTYNIFNPQDHTFSISNIIASGGQPAGESVITVLIPYGTYTGEQLALKLTQLLNSRDENDIDNNKRLYNNDQRKLHIEMGIRGNIPIRESKSYDYREVAGKIDTVTNLSAVGINDIKAGMAIRAGGNYRRVYNISTSNSVTTFNYLTDANDSVTSGTISTDGTDLLVNEGWICSYDSIHNCFILSHGTYKSWIISSTNTLRVVKTFGFYLGQVSKIKDFDEESNGSSYDGSRFKVGGATNWDRATISRVAPELSGPSSLYLRLGGDILLDQQNTETSYHDRIPIPIDVPPGSVVHYENNDKTDIIPFSVPCDVSHIKIRFEYGDDNYIPGGDDDNLRGHYTYLRLKFYFAHENI